LLLGGLLKGDLLSLNRRLKSAMLTESDTRYEALDEIRGFSARFIGGGTALVSRSRSRSRSLLSSADRRGGGGEGGCDGASRGDLAASRMGVCGVLLGILKERVGVAGEADLISESGFRKLAPKLPA
jgi:hypothetical protein